MSKQLMRLLIVVLVAIFVMGAPGAVQAIPAFTGRSAVVDDDVFLEGMYLSVGISGAGSFGTYNAAPAGFHPTPYYYGRIGLSVDQDGFDIGNPPTTGDFFLPGDPEERFVVGYKIEGVPSAFNNAETMGEVNVIRTSVTNLSTAGVLGAQWVGSTKDGDKLRVTQTVQFQADKRFFRNTITLRNTGTVPLDSVRYMRNVDPDQDQDVGGSFTTNNEVVVQQTADGKALVRATGLKSGVSMFYYSADARARVSTFGFSNRNPYDAEAYDNAGVYSGTTYLYPKGTVVRDQAISICADLGTLQPGQEQRFVYYTSLDANFQDSLDDIENDAEYTIAASAGIGGTISPVGNISVSKGGDKTFTITATPPYAIAAILVDGNAVSPTGSTTATYTFTNVRSNHTIRAEFRFMDAMAPVIELPDGVPQAAVRSPYDLHLVVTDDTSVADVGVFENGVRLGSSSTGGDIRVRLALSEGRHQLTIVAFDGFGNRTERAVTLVLDTRPPVVTIDPPASVSKASLTLAGSAIDEVSGLASLTINGEAVTPFLDGSFSIDLALTRGANQFVVEATDRAGNMSSRDFTVKYAAPSATAPSSIYVVLAIGNTDMQVNGMSRKMDAAPFIKDGRTLLPIRALIETLGGSVQWNASTKTATVALGGRTVALTVGSKTAVVNGSPVTLDVAPMIVKGRTFLPLRAVAENIGLDLAWEAVSQTVSFTYWP